MQQNVSYSQNPPRHYASCILMHKNAINLLKLSKPSQRNKSDCTFENACLRFSTLWRR